MDGIGDILNSLSDDDIGRIKNLAGSILGSEKKEEQEQSTSSFDPEMLKNIMNIMSRINSSAGDDSRSNFILSLKPLLSEKRQAKADEAIKMMRIFDLLPIIKESGLLSGLGGELFGL